MYSDYTYPLGKLIQLLSILYHLYADDTQTQKSFNPRNSGAEDKARSVIERSFSEISTWMFNNKLRLNPDKTEFIIFSSKVNSKRISTKSLLLDSEEITAVPVVRNLGVLMDNRLTLDAQLAHVVKSCYYYLNWIKKIRKYLSKEVAKSIVHALVISRIDYCNGLYINLPKYATEKLQRIMRSAARLIAQPSWNASITKICKELHWLPVPERTQFKVLTLVYKAIHDDAPSYLSEMIQRYRPQRKLRSTSSNLLAVKKTRVRYGARAFSVSGPELWNQLPSDIRNSQSLSIFKRKLKTYLFQKAYF